MLQLDEIAEIDVTLLVSELVSNCLLHAGLPEDGRIVLCVRRDDREVLVEVCDEGGRFGKASSSPARTGGGRGLKLVEALSSRWGVRHDGITLVWFTYDLTEPPDVQL